jgi:type II secretory pathway pseudopilin PulG
MFAPSASAGLRQAGINIDASSLPSLTAIEPHLIPTVSSVRRVEAGILMEQHATIGGIDIASTAPVSIALLLPAVQQAREAARRAQSMNNMRQIGLSMHNYHDVNQRFPASSYDKDGKPLLSWRVHVLPYLEGQNLYEQFHLDEPWDSEHNRQLIAQMPAVYQNPSLGSENTQGKTTYLQVTGKGALFNGKKGPSFAEISDGTSNTIAVVEADPGKAADWTKPDDLKLDPENPTAGLGGLRGGQFMALFCDGSVRMISTSIDKNTLKYLFDPRDGNPISAF